MNFEYAVIWTNLSGLYFINLQIEVDLSVNGGILKRFGKFLQVSRFSEHMKNGTIELPELLSMYLRKANKHWLKLSSWKKYIHEEQSDIVHISKIQYNNVFLREPYSLRFGNFE